MPRDELGQRSETVRRTNLSVIVRELHARGALSRSELVVRSGLTRSAIRGLIGELVANGLVSETRAAHHASRGRPSPVVRPNPAGATVLALDIEVDSIAAAIVGLGGEIIDQIRADRPRLHSSVSQIAADLGGLASTLRTDGPSPRPHIGIGVAVVGVVRRSDGVVSMAPNLGWVDVGLRDALLKVFGDEAPIHVANEADLSAVAEARWGVAKGADDILFLSGEVGVGGGILVNGKPFIGAAGYGGEVGHMPVNPMGLPCRCGAVGCWETEAGSESLLRRAGRSPASGPDAIEALLAEAEAGSRTPCARWKRPDAGSGSASPDWSICSTQGSSCSAACSGGSIRSWLRPSRLSSIDGRLRRPVDSFGSSHRSSGGGASSRRGRTRHGTAPRGSGEVDASPGGECARRRSEAQEGGSLAPTYRPM